MTELKDFKVGEKAYILYLHRGYNRAPEIFETTVKKVGKRYVTVTNMQKQFKRHGNVEGLLEHADFGELGYLWTKSRGYPPTFIHKRCYEKLLPNKGVRNDENRVNGR